jgi:hypothetical protein
VSGRKEILKRLDKLRRYHWRGYEREPKSVAAAAQYLRLDPHDARQREALLYLLADVIFGQPAKKGRPKGSKPSWGSSRLLTLGNIYDAMKYDNPKLSDTKIAELIKNKCPEFKHDEPEQIRQRLRPAHEEFLEWWREHSAEFASEAAESREADDDLYNLIELDH